MSKDDPRSGTVSFENIVNARLDFDVVPGTEEYRYSGAGTTDRSTYTDWLTPIEAHYILHRNEIPNIDSDSWNVSLTGSVEENVDLSMQEIKEKYPTVAVAHTMECAGNGRAYFEDMEKVLWGCQGVSTAIWTGVPVSSILHDFGADTSEDMWLTAIGGDEPEEDHVFVRSIPMSKATEDCILAYEMNGEPLPPEHGYPVRLIVPGWYGVNSVKWLDELRVMETMVHDDEWDGDPTWQQKAYRLFPAETEPEHRRTIDTFDTQGQLESDKIDAPYTYDQNVMSLIGYPHDDTVVESEDSTDITISGVAWAGDNSVDRVEVSTDGGETWSDAELFGPKNPHAWRLFRYQWETSPGQHTLMSRATDDRGRTQPATVAGPDDEWDQLNAEMYPWNEQGYGNNAYKPYAVEVAVTR